MQKKEEIKMIKKVKANFPSIWSKIILGCIMGLLELLSGFVRLISFGFLYSELEHKFMFYSLMHNYSVYKMIKSFALNKREIVMDVITLINAIKRSKVGNYGKKI